MTLTVDIPNGQLILMKPNKDNLDQKVLTQDNSKLIVQSQMAGVRVISYFTDYRSMGTIGRIAAFRLNFLEKTKIGRSIP